MIELSICIPTKNRSEYLKKTLESIVVQEAFIKGLIEIVVSDNASTDDTKNLVLEYENKFPTQFIFYRYNREVHVSQNIYNSLTLATGRFLKLNNDTLIHLPNSLDVILNTIKVESDVHFLFFNGSINTHKKIIDKSEFLKEVSFKMTWSGAYGFWQEDIKKIKEIPKSDFPHLEMFLNLLEEKGNVRLVNKILFKSIVPQVKGGYNLYDVFFKQYFNLLRKHFPNKNHLKEEEKIILRNHIIPWHLNCISEPKRYQFEVENWRKIIWENLNSSSLIGIAIIIEIEIRLMFNNLIKKLLG